MALFRLYCGVWILETIYVSSNLKNAVPRNFNQQIAEVLFLLAADSSFAYFKFIFASHWYCWLLSPEDLSSWIRSSGLVLIVVCRCYYTMIGFLFVCCLFFRFAEVSWEWWSFFRLIFFVCVVWNFLVGGSVYQF